MSHITKASIPFKIDNDQVLKTAIASMRKEGYAITENNGAYDIDLSSVGIKHAYHDRRGSQWSTLKLQKDEKRGEYSLSGDRWSIQEGYDRTVKTLQKNYQIAVVTMALKMSGFMAPTIRQEEKTTANSVGKVKIRAVRG